MTLAGVDLIPGSGTSEYRILEVNDRPNGWANIPQICHAIQSAARNRGCDVIYIVAPPSISTEGKTIRPPMQASREWKFRDLRIEQLIADLTLLDSMGNAAVALGDVSAAQDYAMQSTRTLYIDKATILDPLQLADTGNQLMNSPHFRAACEDKLTTRSILSSNGVSMPGLYRPNESGRAATGLVVEKPRYGSAGIGIRFSYIEDRETLDIGASNLAEEWCEPLRVKFRDWSYFADIRVYVCDGKPCGAIARLASAPAGDHAQIRHSHASLLTTTGRTIPANLVLSVSRMRVIEEAAVEAVECIEVESVSRLLNFAPFPSRPAPVESAAAIEAA